MLLIVSLIMVLGYSAYFYKITRGQNDKKDSSLSKCMPMAFGMTSSVTVGLVIATWIPQKLALTTILSMLLSALIAILIGAGFGISGIIEAQASSMMGAMMGAMLGVMLAPQEMVLMVMALDVVFLLSFYLITWILTKTLVDKQKTILHKRPAIYYMTFVLSISIICSVGFMQSTNLVPKAEEEIKTHHNDSSEHQH